MSRLGTAEDATLPTALLSPTVHPPLVPPRSFLFPVPPPPPFPPPLRVFRAFFAPDVSPAGRDAFASLIASLVATFGNFSTHVFVAASPGKNASVAERNAQWKAQVVDIQDSMSPRADDILLLYDPNAWSGQYIGTADGIGTILLTEEASAPFFAYLVSHEYFHRCQHAYLGDTIFYEHAYVWLIEGSATALGLLAEEETPDGARTRFHDILSSVRSRYKRLPSASRRLDDAQWFNTTIGRPQQTYQGTVVNYDLSVVLTLLYWNVTEVSPLRPATWHAIRDAFADTLSFAHAIFPVNWNVDAFYASVDTFLVSEGEDAFEMLSSDLLARIMPDVVDAHAALRGE